MERISEHISYEEAIHSNKAIALGIDNTPNKEQLEAMKLVAEKCFEPLRRWYGKAIFINNFFRCWLLNKAVGGSKTSDHPNGCAIDIDTRSISENKKLFDWCIANLDFDQLIWENGGEWIHISFRKTGNRKQVLYLKQKLK